MKLGDAWEVDKTEAVDSLRKSLAIVESLAASDPGNARAQRDLGLIAYRFGEVLNLIGDYSGALEKYQKALAVHERLSAQDPKDTQARFDAASVGADIAEAYVNLRDAARAIENGTTSLSMFENLVVTDPANMVYLRSVGLCYEVLARAHGLIGFDVKLSADNRIEQWHEARNWYQKALKVFVDLRNRGALRPTDKDKPDDLAAKLKACDQAIEGLKTRSESSLERPEGLHRSLYAIPRSFLQGRSRRRCNATPCPRESNQTYRNGQRNSRLRHYLAIDLASRRSMSHAIQMQLS